MAKLYRILFWTVVLLGALIPFLTTVRITASHRNAERAVIQFEEGFPQIPVNDIHHDQDGTKQTRRYAYTWLLGGVHPDRHGYKGFLYTSMISMRVLRRLNSKADFVVYVQLSPDNPSNTLIDVEEQWLRQLGARIIYLEKPTRESFAAVVYEKFRPLQLTEYDRVIFLDADMMPLRNLDYLMDASMDGVIGPNFIMATRGEPCNAAFFMLQPEEGAWDDLQSVIKRQFEQAKDLPYPHFDRQDGWGHNFRRSGDNWEAIKQKGKNWFWHAVHSDQGLLYQWAKYHKMNTTIFIGEKVQTWVPSMAGTEAEKNLPKLLSEGTNTLDAYAEPRDRCNVGDWKCAVPYRDWKHFAGSQKPWTQESPTSNFFSYSPWFKELKQMNDDMKMEIPVSNWTLLYERLKDPPLGKMAMWADHANHVGKMNDTELDKHIQMRAESQ